MDSLEVTALDLLILCVFWAVPCHRWLMWLGRPILAPTPGHRSKTDETPLVSIILPARNEAHQIGRCLQSLLRQDYPRFEVIVVDDCSDDDTSAIVSQSAEGDRDLTLVQGVPLPEGWMGKAHAAYQGYRRAAGQWLLFTDADTEHDPCLLSGVMSHVLESRASFATVMTRQIHPTFGVYLVNLAVLTYIYMICLDPRGFSNPRSRQSLVNGQYLLFSREAYEAIGTHKAVRHYSSTDVSLGYLAKLDGWCPVLIDGRQEIQTTMYRGFPEAFSGWSRSLVNGNWTAFGPVLGTVALMVTAVGMCLFWISPWIGLAGNLIDLQGKGVLLKGLHILAGITLLKVGSGHWGKAMRDGLLAPFAFTLFLSIAASGLLTACIRGGTVWKERLVRTRHRLPPWKPRPVRTPKG